MILFLNYNSSYAARVTYCVKVWVTCYINFALTESYKHIIFITYTYGLGFRDSRMETSEKQTILNIPPSFCGVL